MNNQGKLIASSDINIYNDGTIIAQEVNNNLIQHSAIELFQAYPTLNITSIEKIVLDKKISYSANQLQLPIYNIQSSLSSVYSIVVFDNHIWLQPQMNENLQSLYIFIICLLLSIYLCYIAYLLPDTVKDMMRRKKLSLLHTTYNTLERIQLFISARQRGFLKIILGLIMLIIGLLWLFWSFSVEQQTDDSKLIIAESIMNNMEAKILHFLSTTALLIMNNIEHRLIKGNFINDITSTTIPFTNTSLIFKNNQIYLNELRNNINEPVSNAISSIYFITDQGNNIMISKDCYINKDTSSLTTCMAIKSEDIPCYTEFALDDDYSINTNLYATHSIDCSYNILTQTWYNNARLKKTKVWNDIFTYRNGDVGTTLSIPMYQSNTDNNSISFTYDAN